MTFLLVWGWCGFGVGWIYRLDVEGNVKGQCPMSSSLKFAVLSRSFSFINIARMAEYVDDKSKTMTNKYMST